MTSSTPYMASVAQRYDELLTGIEDLLAQCCTTPAGGGLIDLITRQQFWKRFIEQSSALGVAINCVTLWCDCTSSNRSQFGCPHGYGGPPHEDGYFSEICEVDPFDVTASDANPETSFLDPSVVVRTCNELALEYCARGIRKRSEYSPCLVPGFWLAVPDHWKRRSYRIDSEPRTS